MQLLTIEESRSWCERAGLVRDDFYFKLRAPGRAYRNAYVGTIDAGAEVSFDVAECLTGGEKAGGFQGALLLTESRGFQGYKRLVYDRLVRGYGLTPGAEGGLAFGTEELADATAWFGVFLDFEWDCYWVPAHGQYFIRGGDTDRFVDVMIVDEAWDQRLIEIMKAWEWDKELKLRQSMIDSFLPT